MSKVNSPSAKILFAEAQKQSLSPRWLIPEVFFVVTKNNYDHFVHATKSHLNSQLGTQICDNKVATHLFLDQLQVPAIPYTYSTNLSDINRFFDTHHQIVSKPISGMRAKDTVLITNRSEFASLDIKRLLFEKFIIGEEYRYLILNHQLVALQHRKISPLPTAPWHKQIINLSLSDQNTSLTDASLGISKRLHMGFLAVDWMIDQSGQAAILELNAAPGITSCQDIVPLLLKCMIDV